MRLAIDASACLEICLSESGFDLVSAHDLVAPHLIASEVLSALRSLDWRRDVSTELIARARGRLPEMPVRRDDDPDHLQRAWSIAADLGWAKTYDAEYLAVAIRHDIPLLTLDARLQRGAAGLARILTPTEL
jgi:predicted nucleic acid-binding protein